MKTGEQFECGNCYHVGHLDLHGGCEHCHSQAVVSKDLLELVRIREEEKQLAA